MLASFTPPNSARTGGWFALRHGFRFLQNVGEGRNLQEVTAAELGAARMHWVRVVQRKIFTSELEALQRNSALPSNSKIARYNSFLEDGLIRLGGRQKCSDLRRERHPLLLVGSHRFTELLILQTHIRLHHFGARVVLSELRTKFARGRQSIKRVLHKCLPCKISNYLRGQQNEAPLRAERVMPSRPFAVTGVDFSGPLYIKVGKETQRANIALFACATTWAVHLELSTDMTSAKFPMALQRFVGSRGHPHTVYSDNATFRAANLKLAEVWHALSCCKTHQIRAQNGVAWKFICTTRGLVGKLVEENGGY